MHLTAPNKTIEDYVQQYQLADVLNDMLLNNMELFHFPIYSQICIEGTELQYLYFLVEGQVQCSHHHLNGKLAVIALSNPLELIGDLEILDEDHLRSNVIATQPTTLLGIKKQIVRQYGVEDAVFLQFLLKQYRGKLYRSNALQVNQVLPLSSRLSLYMLSQINDKDTSIVLPAKEELASLMGTTTRHLNRVLRQLIDSEYIGASYPRITIHNRSALEDLAHT